MAKRFTDTRKWRNEWFRTLPIKAKLAWTYLCDECCGAGIWKADYGLASFQLDFKISAEDIKGWFGHRVYFFGNDSVLLVPFFEFQYGESKDTWSAKVNARTRLENLGFTILENKIQLPQSPHCDPTVGVECDTLLSIDIVKGKDKGIKGGVGEKQKLRAQFEKAYTEIYPLKKGRSKGVEVLLKSWREDDSIDSLISAITRYRDEVVASGTEKRFIKHFSTFAAEWRDWLASDAGNSMVSPSGPKTGVEKWMEQQSAKEKAAAG